MPAGIATPRCGSAHGAQKASTTITFTVARGPATSSRRWCSPAIRRSPDAELETLVRLKPKDVLVQSRLEDARRAMEAAYRLAASRACKWPPPSEARARGRCRLGPPRRSAVRHHRRPADHCRSVTFDGQMAISEAELQKAAGIGAGRPFLGRRARGRPGCDRACVSRSRLRRRGRGGRPRPARKRHPSRRPFHDPGRRTSPRRSRHHRRQRADRGFDDRAGAGRARRRAARGLGAHREPDSARRARRVPPHSDRDDLPMAREPRRDVLVRVEEAPPTTLGFGGGLEGGFRLRPTAEGGQAEERIEFAPRGFFQIGRRNLWGKNRQLNLFTRASLRSRDITGAPERSRPTAGYGFNEYRVRRHVPRAPGVPHPRRGAGDRHLRAGHSIQLQLHAPGGAG